MNTLSVSLSKKQITWGLVYWAVQLLVLPQILTWGNVLFSSPLSQAQLNFLFFSINFLVITLLYYRFLWKNLQVLLRRPFQVLRYAGAGLLLYWVSSFLVNLLIYAFCPDFVNYNDQSVAAMGRENYVLIFMGTVFLVPVVEEMLYRGVVFGAFLKKSPVAAYTLSTVLFGAVHLLGFLGKYTPLQLLLSFLQYVPAGLCLAWAYQRADSIWAPILIHIAVNQVGNASVR